ncbi:ABC transporter permease [Cohnella silvisoli]|uniref:ABC transporter permease subunit n=1 Tax=Cohnella silvisoli TaxID=2873699 RepID=A0ABV1KTX9_9BACL|nr:ABC transporter permease subunit [Cohnella silvisoli]MCD9022698.1 ABC transporter permease subunit [Cohnella silvisoli]
MGDFFQNRNGALHVMIFPAVVLLFVFSYVPLFGLTIAFQKYNIFKGIFDSAWIGFGNFRFVLSLPDIYQVLWNTFYIAIMKIAAGLIVPVAFALLLNEVRSVLFKKTVQTIVYFPYFLSWVLLGGILIDILSPSTGIVNDIMAGLGFKPVFFLGDASVFPYVLVATDTWKSFGFGTIVYLAALTNIDQSQYEASIIDGASRWKQALYITLPGILPTVILMATLSLGGILNAGFDQIFNLYSPIVYRTGDIIDTMVYRMGLVDRQYGPAAAIGFFKSVVSFVLIVISYKLAGKFANYRIF